VLQKYTELTTQALYINLDHNTHMIPIIGLSMLTVPTLGVPSLKRNTWVEDSSSPFLSSNFILLVA